VEGNAEELEQIWAGHLARPNGWFPGQGRGLSLENGADSTPKSRPTGGGGVIRILGKDSLETPVPVARCRQVHHSDLWKKWKGFPYR